MGMPIVTIHNPKFVEVPMRATGEPVAQAGDSPIKTEIPVVQPATPHESDLQLLSEPDELRQLRKLGLDENVAALLRSLGVC